MNLSKCKCLLSSLVICLATLLTVQWVCPCHAQEPFRVGDAVEFDFGNLPLSGKVVESQGDGRVLKIEVFFQGQNRTFTRMAKSVRKVGGEPSHPAAKTGANTTPKLDAEPAAKPQPQSRKWTDATGNFSVEAKLSGFDGTTVELTKADGGLVRVPLAKLSAEDQQYVSGTGDAGSPLPQGSSSLQLPEITAMPSGPVLGITSLAT